MKWYEPTIEPPSLAEGESTDTGGGNPDREIFERFLRHDDSALVELFDRHNHRLYLYCLHLVGTEQQAEDVTQELWERVLRLRAAGTATADNPVGLLIRIARNLSLDALRRNRHHAALDDLPEAKHPVAQIAELSHLEELVILALPNLPIAQREVLVLNAYSGYGFDEIAKMLSEPVGAIRMRACRARAHLGRIISAMVGMNEDSENDQGRGEVTR
jgi:RNA polymerase sigma-70 factor (ECF subfamily)